MFNCLADQSGVLNCIVVIIVYITASVCAFVPISEPLYINQLACPSTLS